MPNKAMKEVDDWQDVPAANAAADDWQDVPTPTPRPKKTMLESGISGTADMLTFGNSDEISAAMRAGADAPFSKAKFGDLYDQYLNEQRAHKAQAEEDNPGSYFAGQAVGAVGPAVIGGPAALGPAVGKSVGQNLLRAAGTGALMGAGQSNARPTDSFEKAEEFAGDVAGGAGMGVATQGLFGMGGAVAKGVASKLRPSAVGSVMLGLPEEAANLYIQNPAAVNAARSTPELTQDVLGSINKLQGEVTGGSQAARQTLATEGKKISGETIADIAKKRKDAIIQRAEGRLDDEDKATVGWLQKLEDDWRGIGTEAEESIPTAVSTNRVKDLVQKTRRGVNYDVGGGKFMPVDDRVRAAFASDVDQVLKSTSPEYVNQMAGVAKDTDLLSRSSELAGTPQAMENLLKRVQRERAYFPAQTIGELDKRMGTNLLQDLKLSQAKEAFEKGSSGPGGSRMVNLYKEIGRDVGEKSNVPFGGSVGAVVGATMDKYGPKIGKRILDAAAKSRELVNSSDAAQRLGKYAPILKMAVSRGPASVISTNRYLMQDPEYRKLILPEAAEEP